MATIRKRLSAVSFGGNWSEELLVDRQLTLALEVIDRAATECTRRNVEDDALASSLNHIQCRVRKGRELADAFRRSVRITNTGIRQMEARRIAAQIRASAGLK